MMEHNKCYGLVFDIIKKYASEDKPISQTEILKKIISDPENSCDRKTVGRAITRLIAQYGKDEDGDWVHEKIHFHYKEIPRGNSPILKDFWFEFEEDEGGVDVEQFVEPFGVFARPVLDALHGRLRAVQFAFAD